MREPSSVAWAICPPYFAVIGMEFMLFQPALITWLRARDANTKSIMMWVKMVGAVLTMAICASVPGQRSPRAARATATTRLAAALGLREGVRLARAPTTKLAPRSNAFGALQGGLTQGGLSCTGSLWFGSAREPL
jgi:hypothetical protein